MKKTWLLIVAMALTSSAYGAIFSRQTIGTPNNGTVVSGVGVFSGYSCDSKNIEIFVDGISLGKAGAGTNMPLMADPSLCGHADVGYSLLYNYNKFAAGQHTVTATADGNQFASSIFYTIKLNSSPTPWVSGLTKEITINDFPAIGQTSTLDWVESYQNFVITNVQDNLTNNSNTSKLVGGTWTFAYTISTSLFTNDYTFTTVDTTPDSNGDYYAYGTGTYGDNVIGGYDVLANDWSVLDPGSIIDRFFVFSFTDANHVSGCYYQVNPPGSGIFSSCYPMSGLRSNAVVMHAINAESIIKANENILLELEAVKNDPVRPISVPAELINNYQQQRHGISNLP